MKLLTNLIFLFLLESFGISKTIYPDIWEKMMSQKDWESITETEKYKLSKFQFDGFSIPAFKIEMILKAQPQTILDVAWNVAKYPESLPSAYITEAGIYQNKDSTQIAWQVMDIPFLAPRLYQYQHVRKKYRVDWYNTAFKQHIDKDILRASTNVGSWSLSINGEENVLTYIVLTDPGGLVPAWIIKKAQMKYLPQMLKEAENSALKLKK